MPHGWALITGASGGLGAEIAKIAAREGWNLVLAARSRDRLEALAADLAAAHGIEVVVDAVDLAQPGAAEALWDRAAEGREIDILVNNAGLGSRGPYATARTRESAILALNIVAFEALLSRAVPAMRARGKGRILNVASLAGFMPGPNGALYHASKAFALSLSEAIATELDDSGVSVTTLCPGTMQTGYAQAPDMPPTLLRKLFPVGRPENVAARGWAALLAGERTVVTGAHNRLFAQLPRLFSRRFLARLTAKMRQTAG